MPVMSAWSAPGRTRRSGTGARALLVVLFLGGLLALAFVLADRSAAAAADAGVVPAEVLEAADTERQQRSPVTRTPAQDGADDARARGPRLDAADTTAHEAVGPAAERLPGRADNRTAKGPTDAVGTAAEVADTAADTAADMAADSEASAVPAVGAGSAVPAPVTDALTGTITDALTGIVTEVLPEPSPDGRLLPSGAHQSGFESGQPTVRPSTAASPDTAVPQHRRADRPAGPVACPGSAAQAHPGDTVAGADRDGGGAPPSLPPGPAPVAPAAAHTVGDGGDHHSAGYLSGGGTWALPSGARFGTGSAPTCERRRDIPEFPG